MVWTSGRCGHNRTHFRLCSVDEAYEQGPHARGWCKLVCTGSKAYSLWMFLGYLWHFVLYLVPRLLQSSFLFNVQGRKGILIASLRYINTWKCQQFARFEYCFMFIWLVFGSPVMSDSTEDPGKATRIPSEFLDFSPGTEANEEIAPSVDDHEAGVVNENYGEQWWIKFPELSAESRYHGEWMPIFLLKVKFHRLVNYISVPTSCKKY